MQYDQDVRLISDNSLEEPKMCRSIQKLRRPEGSPNEEEVRAAALQFVRKVSGYRKPSRAN